MTSVGNNQVIIEELKQLGVVVLEVLLTPVPDVLFATMPGCRLCRDGKHRLLVPGTHHGMHYNAVKAVHSRRGWWAATGFCWFLIGVLERP